MYLKGHIAGVFQINENIPEKAEVVVTGIQVHNTYGTIDTC
jgi:hypothetical protein